MRESLVPVIETGTGNCHTYVHASADFAKARAIVMNAKTQRVGVCNACESLLVDEAVTDAFLPGMLAELAAAGVTITETPLPERLRATPTSSAPSSMQRTRIGDASTSRSISACTR